MVEIVSYVLHSRCASPRLNGVVPLGPPGAPAELELGRPVVLPLLEQAQVPEVVDAVAHRGNHSRGHLQQPQAVVPENVEILSIALLIR